MFNNAELALVALPFKEKLTVHVAELGSGDAERHEIVSKTNKNDVFYKPNHKEWRENMIFR